MICKSTDPNMLNADCSLEDKMIHLLWPYILCPQVFKHKALVKEYMWKKAGTATKNLQGQRPQRWLCSYFAAVEKKIASAIWTLQKWSTRPSSPFYKTYSSPRLQAQSSRNRMHLAATKKNYGLRKEQGILNTRTEKRSSTSLLKKLHLRGRSSLVHGPTKAKANGQLG